MQSKFKVGDLVKVVAHPLGHLDVVLKGKIGLIAPWTHSFAQGDFCRVLITGDSPDGRVLCEKDLERVNAK